MKKSVKVIVTVLLVAALLVPTVAMLISSAATSYTVELAFNNIFVFEQWAGNKSSTMITSDGTGGSSDGKLVTDINAGSLTLTSNITTASVYTTASMGKGADAAANASFYNMAVKPGAIYSLSYNVDGSVNGGFHPYIFFYDETGEFRASTALQATAVGDNSAQFAVPDYATHIQIRFTLPPQSTSATVKNISICEYEVNHGTDNKFDFATWSSKTGSGAGKFSLWGAGTVTSDSTEKSVTLTSDGSDSGTDTGVGACSVLLTNMAWNGTYGDTNYVIDTEPGKQYIVSYDLEGTMDSPANASFFFVGHKTDKSNDGSFTQKIASTIGKNFHIIDVPANIYHFEVVFGLYDHSLTNGKYAKFKNIEIYEINSIVDHKIDTTRKTYTYSGDGSTYGTLPTPPDTLTPDGQIFAGWYTGKDGTGMRIGADTEIQPMSYTVYPKYEPAVDTLTVKTPPTKLTYTVGEKLNTTGLVLTYGINTLEDTDGDGTAETTVLKTTDISSGFYCTPSTLDTVGTQTVTVHYGGKTATFNVTVTDGDDKSILVNSEPYSVTVANNTYILDYTGSAFNRYEMSYFSDSYVKGIITFTTGVTEDFFLEPSDNGSFASYIDNFLLSETRTEIKSISFTCLDKEFGNFELLSLTTINATVPNRNQFYYNDHYKVGIDLGFGGVIDHISVRSEHATKGKVAIAQYTANGKNYTKIDYASLLDSNYNTNQYKDDEVNLINTNDRGRYLQQSYYGTYDKPYELGDYNGVPWNYNPVQGGNLQITDENGNVIKGNEASKVIDYRITDSGIYVKTRPLDWGKNSTDYPDSYVTPSYMEAWYTFEGELIKTSCRFVDFSGYPSYTTTQELPALYISEPLNHFVYNSSTTAWDSNPSYKNIEEPEFWGILPSYNEMLTKYGLPTVNPDVTCVENWAAFTASENEESFGIGVYSAGITNFHYGCFPAIYNEEEAANGNKVDTVNRHAQTLNAYVESPTSYIAPVGITTMESYKPITYTYYVSTGTADEIREDFRQEISEENQAELAKTKIAVPETVYMTPVADGATYTTTGKYYVNNILNSGDNYNVETIAESADNMYFGIYAQDMVSFTVSVSNATDSTNGIELVDASGNQITSVNSLNGVWEIDNTWNLNFSGTGLKPGEIATAKWDITVTKSDGSTDTYTAYTVLYAPERTVGAVAESRRFSDVNNEVSSWITGANGVDHSQRAPLGSFKGDYRNSGYFKSDPLVNPDTPPTGGSSETAYDYILGYGTANGSDDDYQTDCYVMQTATNGEDDSRSQSYLGLLTVDKSRYTNTNQIPNLKIGFDALRVGSTSSDSLQDFKTFYTLGTESSFTSTSLDDTPSGWTTHENTSYDGITGSGGTIPYRTTVVPSYNVSEIDGKYIHALSWGHCYRNLYNKYATAGTSVLCSVTDKSELRDSVLNGYTMVEDDPEFNEALEKAATVLGDPSASQEEIDNAKKELNNAAEELVETFYALKYDNLFSAYEFSQNTYNMTMSQPDYSSISYADGKLTVINEDMSAGETFSIYSNKETYRITVEPNTEYVFEYDVTTTVNSQAFLFFYDSNGNAASELTTYQRQIDRGAWTTITNADGTDADTDPDKLPHLGNYQYGAGTKHYAIKFTTGANTTQVGFRFGNTSSSATTSTFSNIKLIDEARYYEDVTYTATEATYKEFASYGTLPTLTRPGYTFGGWKDASGNVVTDADIATEHKSIFSVWNEHSYTISYNANGGSGSIASQTVTYSQNVTLPSTGFTRTDYSFAGWSTDKNATTVQYEPGATVSGLTDVNGGAVTLYAVWKAPMNVTFDNLIDMMAWQNSDVITTHKASAVSDKTETGFSVTNPANDGETTIESPFFAVTPGKSYMIDIDITGDNWDVYIFFCDSNGTWVDFNDGETNRYSAYTTWDTVFTAPDKDSVVKAYIRVDSNHTGAEHKVNFENIRVYEYDGISPIEVTPSNTYIPSGDKFGTLPVPTKEGFEFLGWYDESGNPVTAESVVPTEDDNLVPLTSKWKLANTALTEDKLVVDFGSPMAADINANDTIINNAAVDYGATVNILGISTDDNATSYTDSIDGTYGKFVIENSTVTYTPYSVVNGTDEVYYYAQLSTGEYTNIVKSSVKVVPASNVLYEEKVFTAVSKDNTAKWATEGTAETETQAASSSADVYGYDESYNDSNVYSNGSSIKTTVDSTTKRSETQTVKVKGTGFDLIGSCGDKTGVLIVTVRDSKNAIARVFMVDTYYSDSAILADGGNLNQIPVVSFNDDYDVYTVEVTSAYLNSSKAVQQSAVETYAIDGTEIVASSAVLTNDEIVAEMLAEIGMEELANEEIELVWMDDNSVFNGGTGAEDVADGEVSMFATTLDNYIDAIRVYNPMNGDDYDYIETEQGAQYYNVINNLAATDGTGIFTDISRLFAYIEGSIAGGSNFAEYSSKLPKNELYLSKYTDDSSTGVTFKLNLTEGARVMLSVRAVTGTPELTINGKTLKQISGKSMSKTEMYYDITNVLAATDGVASVAITNTGDGLLAINNMKLVGATPAVVSTFSLDESVALMSLEPVDVEYDGPSMVMPETDDTVDEGDGSEEEETLSCYDKALMAIRSFFSNIFGYIKQIFELIISFFTTKEVF